MRFSRLIVLLAVLVPFTVLFGRALLWGEVLGYRDAANYYLPSFQWEMGEWRAGRVPLWNPHDGLGIPYVADASSSVFYPGKLIFALPLDHVRRFNLYVSIHVLLAAATTYRLGRCLQLSIEASGFAAVAYAFSANVLFQYANVIFLVGAAWFPLAFLASHQMLRQRSLRWSLGLGCVLALMTLGGDPQGAYHVVLLTALYALLLMRADRVAAKQRDHGPSDAACRSSSATSLQRLMRWRLGLLTAACLGGFVMAAIQILPSWEWTRHSDRAAFHTPRSLPEAVSYVREVRRGERTVPTQGTGSAIVRGLLGRPAARTHHEHIYQFSVGPWRWIEFLWPNCTGRNFPENRRWISLLPAESRAWTPSLYIGFLPFVFGLMAWRVGRTTPAMVWLSWCTLIAVLASLGWYGVGWLVHEFRVGVLGAALDEVAVGQPVGGLYWLLVCFLPGYVYFRYPAKWLVVASLGLCLLAAKYLQDRRFASSRVLPRLLVTVGGISLIGALLLALLVKHIPGWVHHAPVDAVFGPLDVLGGGWDACRGLLHTGVVCFVSYFLLKVSIKRRRWHYVHVALVITSFDLLVAQCGFTVTVPPSTVQSMPEAVRAIREGPAGVAGDGPPRVFRASPIGWFPERWSRETEKRRLEQVVRWERDTLLPKHHLAANVSLVESFNSLTSCDYGCLLRVAYRYGNDPEEHHRLPHVNVLNALSAKYMVLPGDCELDSRFAVTPLSEGENREGSRLEATKVLINHEAVPRAWIVHRTEQVSCLSTRDPREIERRVETRLCLQGQPRALTGWALVETDKPLAATETTTGVKTSCRVTRHDPDEVVCEVQLDAPGLLVLNDLYYPGWGACREDLSTGRKESLEVVRANCVMRGVFLPAGQHRVTFRYRPLAFYIGAVSSGLAWLVVLILMARIVYQPSGASPTRKF